jgi:hypothetical protein
MSTTTATAPITPSLQDWYHHLAIEAPPSFRGVHYLGRVSPTHGRYAIIASDGTVIFDGIVAEPMTPELRALLKLALSAADPQPVDVPLRLVR